MDDISAWRELLEGDPRDTTFEDDKELFYKLAQAMVQRRKLERATDPLGIENLDIPAGYTYLSQFVGHDLTFHDTSGTHFAVGDPVAVNVGGDAALDLRSLYGGGPIAAPLLYQRVRDRTNSAKLALGHPEPLPPVTPTNREDVLRLRACPFANPIGDNDPGRRALVADPRNDENLLLSQFTVLFARVHNRLVDLIAPAYGVHEGNRVFHIARKLTTQCYRKIVFNDLLGRLLDEDTLKRLRGAYATESAVSFDFIGEDEIAYGFSAPPEFSFAAFRMGHSMVRDAYRVSNDRPDKSATGPLIALMDVDGPTLPITEDWIVDWRRFFFTPDELDAGGHALRMRTRDGSERTVNYSHRIKLSSPHWLGDGTMTLWLGADGRNGVIYRDLVRARRRRIATAKEFLQRFPAITPRIDLFDPGLLAQSLSRPGGGFFGGLTAEEIGKIAERMPLYVYTLLEAEHDPACQGRKLGPVGSTIVGETIVGAMMSQPGYLNDMSSAEHGWMNCVERAMPATMLELVDFDEEVRAGL